MGFQEGSLQSVKWSLDMFVWNIERNLHNLQTGCIGYSTTTFRRLVDKLFEVPSDTAGQDYSDSKNWKKK